VLSHLCWRSGCCSSLLAWLLVGQLYYSYSLASGTCCIRDTNVSSASNSMLVLFVLTFMRRMYKKCVLCSNAMLLCTALGLLQPSSNTFFNLWLPIASAPAHCWVFGCWCVDGSRCYWLIALVMRYRMDCYHWCATSACSLSAWSGRQTTVVVVMQLVCMLA
jgi:hypothetical protein